MSRSEGQPSPMTLKEHDAATREAWRAHHDEWECPHKETAERKRAVAGGGWQLVRQCTWCGTRVGNALSQAGVRMDDVMEFDEDLNGEYQRDRTEAAEKVRSTFSRDSWLASYGPYLASPEWRVKRQRVLQRAGGSCEGCGERPPTQVHHLSYEHVGKEFLFELVALCDPCHERIHAEEGAA